MKNRGMDRRHPPPGGSGVLFFKGGENKIRREKATGKERKEGELHVTENNERQRTKGNKLIGTNRE